jgi:hypothetical protein
MRASSSGRIGRLLLGLLIALHLMVATTEASAQRRGGGGGGRARGGGGGGARAGGGGGARPGGGGGARAGGGAQARTSVNRDFNAGGGDRSFSGTNVNRNAANVNRTNVDRNVNRNVNRDINRDVNIDNDWGWDADNHWHPFATGAAVVAGAALTAAAVGSVVNTLPTSCVATVVNGVTYQQCGSSWYEPRFYGSSVEYVVVNAP